MRFNQIIRLMEEDERNLAANAMSQNPQQMPGDGAPQQEPTPIPPKPGEQPENPDDLEQNVPDVEIPTVNVWSVLEKFIKDNKGKKVKL